MQGISSIPKNKAGEPIKLRIMSWLRSNNGYETTRLEQSPPHTIVRTINHSTQSPLPHQHSAMPTPLAAACLSSSHQAIVFSMTKNAGGVVGESGEAALLWAGPGSGGVGAM
jgi:hypothetical protein